MAERKIRMIGFDLDGTTLQEDHRHFSDRLLRAFAQAQEMGVRCVPVTGRPPVVLPEPVAEHFDLFPVSICSDGAIRVRTKERAILEAIYMKKEKLEACVRYFRDKELPMELNGLSGLYVSQRDYDLAYRSGGELLRHVQYCMSFNGVVKEDLLEAVFDEEERFDKLNLMRVPMEKHELVDSFLAKQDLTSCYLNEEYLEVTESGVNKGSALERYAAELGIPIGEVMVLGDSGNDVAMFHTGAFKVAVANAEKAILSLADAVTLRNVEDGAAIAIEKYVLGVKE